MPVSHASDNLTRVALTSALMLLTLGRAPAAVDEPGTVAVTASSEIWKPAGKPVSHAQFTPDGSRIVAAAGGTDSVCIASMKPDGTELKELLVLQNASWAQMAISRDSKRVAVIVTQGGNPCVLAGAIDAGLAEVEQSAGATDIAWQDDTLLVSQGRQVYGIKGGERRLLGEIPELPGGPYKLTVQSPDGTFNAATRDVASPVGIVRGAGLWAWKTPKPGDQKVDVRELLSTNEWLVGVAYYTDLIAFAPAAGADGGGAVRFVGARIKPFPGLKNRPLCVWEVAFNDKLERVGEPKRMGTFGWWPRFFRGDPAHHGTTGWNVGIGEGQYMADFSTGRVYKFGKDRFDHVSASYSPDCSLVAVPGKSLRLLTLQKKD